MVIQLLLDAFILTLEQYALFEFFEYLDGLRRYNLQVPK